MNQLNRIVISVVFVLMLPFYSITMQGQINTDQVMRIGRNTLYFEDYLLSIQYFNQVIGVKPYLAQPYFYRAIAKLNLEDYNGALQDANEAIERNPFITDAYEVRGVAAQNLGKYQEAIDDYDKALGMLPDNRGIMYNKALAQSEMKDYKGAHETLGKLISRYPAFDNAYLGRARVFIAEGDTVSALNDIDKAIDINKNAVNGYIMRADLAIMRDTALEGALEDMNQAIRLQPQYAGFFINRAFLKYKLDDYYGAMSDYDYAIQLEPENRIALFNRGMLRAEIRDDNNAINDFSKVISLNPDDYKTLYNRAMLYRQTGNLKGAIADLDKVIEMFPDFAAAYFMRFDCKRMRGETAGAEKDYNKSISLAKKRVKRHPLDGTPFEAVEKSADDEDYSDTAANDTETQESIAKRFTSLTTIDDNTTDVQEYNNKDIRGKLQDRNVVANIEPIFVITYYDEPTELKPGGDYIREVDDINSTHMLHSPLRVTNHEPVMTDTETTRRHFSSVDYYNSYISSHKPRTIDYFGRAMDLMTLRDYEGALVDFNRCIDLNTDFALGYLMRSIAAYKLLSLDNNGNYNIPSKPSESSPRLAAEEHRAALRSIIEDLDKTISLSPSMSIAYFNKGVILLETDDFTGALSAFNKAIELKPDFGEAYYNRGYVYFKLGNRQAGSSDLSKAGELGIISSYNLLKRMTR